MKYVMIQRTLGCVDEDAVTMYPIIFPKELIHKDVADAIIKSIKKAWPKSEVQVISAGEVSVVSGFVGGFSDTLSLESDPADDSIISTVDYFNVHRHRTPNIKK